MEQETAQNIMSEMIDKYERRTGESISISAFISAYYDKNFAGGLEMADALAIDSDQYWEDEKTVFFFNDGSELECQFPHLNVNK